MAVTLSITVTDAQGARAQTALGHWNDPVNPTAWVDATVADVRAMIKAWIKERVINYETTKASETDRTTRSGEVW